jgi:excisionase family DNA binding protein
VVLCDGLAEATARPAAERTGSSGAGKARRGAQRDSRASRPKGGDSTRAQPACNLLGRYDLRGILKLGGRFARFVVSNPEMPDANVNKPVQPQDALLTAEEVAALLRVTPAWVYAETRHHRIPHVRLGRYVRYRRDALAEWMRQLEERPGPASRGRRR